MSDLVDSMPRRVKVGNFIFRVRVVACGHLSLTAEDGNPCWGMTDFEMNRIFLEAGMPLDRLVNTLFHEINHAINHCYGIRDGAREEAVATQNANGWMQVNLDNPTLERWFHRAWQQLRKAR